MTEGNVSNVSPTVLPLEQSLPLADHDHILPKQYISYETYINLGTEGGPKDPWPGRASIGVRGPDPTLLIRSWLAKAKLWIRSVFLEQRL